MTTVFHEIEAEQKLRAECSIPDDWTGKVVMLDLFFIRDTGLVAREIAEKFGIEKWTEIGSMIMDRCTRYSQLEGGRTFEFQPPQGHEMEGCSFLLTATKRDLTMGTKAYLSRLDEDQLQLARDEAASLIKAKRDEAKRVVWRVCDDTMCLGNFREDDYLGAVEFMANEAKRMRQEIGDGPIRYPRTLEIQIKPERVPESEYEDFFA